MSAQLNNYVRIQRGTWVETGEGAWFVIMAVDEGGEIVVDDHSTQADAQASADELLAELAEEFQQQKPQRLS